MISNFSRVRMLSKVKWVTKFRNKLCVESVSSVSLISKLYDRIIILLSISSFSLFLTVSRVRGVSMF